MDHAEFNLNSSGNQVLSLLVHWISSHSFITGASFADWSEVPTEVRHLAAHRNWEMGGIFLLERWVLSP